MSIGALTWKTTDEPDCDLIDAKIKELDAKHPGLTLWQIPRYNGPLTCDLWLMEPEGPMSGPSERWRVDGKSETELKEHAAFAVKAMKAEQGAGLVLAQLEFPLWELNGSAWRIGHFEAPESVESRANMPRGLLILMKAILDVQPE